MIRKRNLSVIYFLVNYKILGLNYYLGKEEEDVIFIIRFKFYFSGFD